MEVHLSLHDIMIMSLEVAFHHRLSISFDSPSQIVDELSQNSDKMDLRPIYCAFLWKFVFPRKIADFPKTIEDFPQ